MENRLWNFFVYMASLCLATVLLLKWLPWLEQYQYLSPFAFVAGFVFLTFSMWEREGNVGYSVWGLLLMLSGGFFVFYVDFVIGVVLLLPGLGLWLFAGIRTFRLK